MSKNYGKVIEQEKFLLLFTERVQVVILFSCSFVGVACLRFSLSEIKCLNV